MVQLSTDFKAPSGLGGFLAGVQDDSNLHSAELLQIAQGLSNQKLMNENLEYEKDTPLRDLKRELALNENNFVKDKWGSGEMAEYRNAELDAKLAKSLEERSNSDKKLLENQANALLQMSNMLGDNPESPENVGRTIAMWEEISDVAKKGGIKTFPSSYSPEAVRRIEAGKRAAWQTSQYYSSKALVEQKSTLEEEQKQRDYRRDVELKGIEAANRARQSEIDAAERMKEVHAQGGYMIEAAKTRLANAGMPKNARERDLRNIQESIDSGVPVDEATFSRASSYATEAIDKSMSSGDMKEQKERIRADVYQKSDKELRKMATELGISPVNITPDKIIMAITEKFRQKQTRQIMKRFDGLTVMGAGNKIGVVKDGVLVPVE